MSIPDTRLSALLDQFTNDLQSPNEDIRRRATDDLYERIIAQYADVSDCSRLPRKQRVVREGASDERVLAQHISSSSHVEIEQTRIQ